MTRQSALGPRSARRRVSARVRRRRAGAVLLLVVLVALLTSFVVRRDDVPAPAAAPVIVASAGPAPVLATSKPAEPSKPLSSLAALAGLGPRAAGSVPRGSRQVLVVRGDGASSSAAAIELYERSSGTWVRSGRWRGHNGAQGWTSDHREGDLRTPTGTYRLSDAGGLLADPGSGLPYHRSGSFVPHGDSVFGDSLRGSFDYVVAIDYNRVSGRSPLDATRPKGWDRGGGIWLHVDHGGPTHGCVSLPQMAMKSLLTTLDPVRHPVVVMGDAATLAG